MKNDELVKIDSKLDESWSKMTRAPLLEDKVAELEARIARLERIAGEQRRHSIAYTPQDMTYK